MSADLNVKKGFIRVLEVVLFTFLVFGVLMSSFFKYSDSNDWSGVQRLALSHDLLFAFEKEKAFESVLAPLPYSYGPNIYNINPLNGTTEKILPTIYDYEYEVKNVPPPRISIGCICDSYQADWLRSILEPNRSLYTVTILNQGNFSDLFQTFVIFGGKNLEPYRENITAALEEGKGFVLVSNFSSQPDNMTRELFGIKYTGGSYQDVSFRFDDSSGTVPAGISKRYINALRRVRTEGENFTGKLYLKDRTYSVSQVLEINCVNISLCSGCLREGESCTIANTAKISLFKKDLSALRWIDIKINSESQNPRDYIFRDYVPLNVERGRDSLLYYGNYAMANAVVGGYGYSYETEPRRFWIYDYDKNHDDLNLLLKTGIIWSTGEHFFISRKEIPEKRTVATHFFTGLRNNSIPFTVKLYTWGY